MTREEKIDNILFDLERSGSDISYLSSLKEAALKLTSKDRSLSEVMDEIAYNLQNETSEFLNGKNKFDVNYISGVSSCVYLPTLLKDDSDVKLKFIGGNRSRNSSLEVDENTMFDVASITKLFTLLLLFELEEFGLIDLNSKVKDVNKDFQGLEDFTFNDLIRMHGELCTDGNIAKAKNKEEAYNILKTMYLKSNTKEENKYTDFGAIVISDTIEKIFNESLRSKANYADIMTDLLLNPDLNNTTFNPKTDNISGNGGIKTVHDPKSRILGGAVGSAGIFTTSDDLATLAKRIYQVKRFDNIVGYSNNNLININHVNRLGEITFPNAKQCNKGNLGIYVKHPLGFAKTFTPSEFSKGSFSHQGWTGSLATFDPNNLIHQNILVNAIYESDDKDMVRNDKPAGFGGVFDNYLEKMTINTMLMHVAKKYYNHYCNSYEEVNKTYKLK